MKSLDLVFEFFFFLGYLEEIKELRNKFVVGFGRFVRI